MNRALNSIAIGAALVFAFAGWPQAAAAIAPITALPSIAAPENNEGSGSCLKRHRPLPSGAHAARKGASRKGKTASDNVANDLNVECAGVVALGRTACPDASTGTCAEALKKCHMERWG